MNKGETKFLKFITHFIEKNKKVAEGWIFL